MHGLETLVAINERSQEEFDMIERRKRAAWQAEVEEEMVSCIVKAGEFGYTAQVHIAAGFGLLAAKLGMDCERLGFRSREAIIMTGAGSRPVPVG